MKWFGKTETLMPNNKICFIYKNTDLKHICQSSLKSYGLNCSGENMPNMKQSIIYQQASSKQKYDAQDK